MRLIVAILIALAGLSSAHARGTAPPAATYLYCTFGPGDGCIAAPAPATAFWCPANFFGAGGYVQTVAGTTTNYVAGRTEMNVPAGDYCIGPYTPIGSLLDPATPGVIPGCTYTANTSFGGTGEGLLTCGGASWQGKVQHINLGPVGGHGCTGMTLNNPAGGVTALLVDDVYAFNDTGLCAYGVGTGAWLKVNAGPITFSNDYFDGNWDVFSETTTGTCAQCNPVAFFGYGALNKDVTIKYSVLRNFAGRTMSIGFTTAGHSTTITNSVVEGWDNRVPNGHTEFSVGPGGGTFVGDYDFENNLVLQSTHAMSFGPGPWLPAANGPLTFGKWDIKNNTLINSFVGGATQTYTFSGCVGASYSSGCVGSGPYFFLTNVSAGTFGPGAVINCGSATFVAYQQVGGPGSGYLSQWSTDAGSNYFPNNIQGPTSCTNVTDFAQIADWAAFNIGGGPLTEITISGNQTDFSSKLNYPATPGMWAISGGQRTTVTGSISGSTLTTSASVTLLAGDYIYQSGICSTSNYLACPEILTTATGTSFPLSISVGTVTLQSLAVVDPTYCGSPTTWGGNFDMGGQTSSGWMNQWVGTPSNFVIGC